MRLKDKIAIITGAGSGIGRAIALAFSKEGAKVVVADWSEQGGKETVEQIEKQKGEAIFVKTDVSKANDIDRMAEDCLNKFGRIDILVNNAGIARDKLLLRMSEEDWDKVIDVDLKSVFLCTKAVLRPMVKQRRGRIISLSSIAGITGNKGQANYASAKAGIIGFTRTVAREVGSHGVTANAVAPGFIETDMTGQMKEDWRQEIKRNIPLGRFGTPRDVAGAVAFLASDEAGYITGQVLGVDGGM